MLAPTLAIWTVLAASLPEVPSDRGAELTRMLGSRLFQTRESAEVELLRLGRGAIPSLRIAKRSRDLEVQLRAVSILERIEGNLLLEPTPIRLGCRNMPLADLVERIRDESGITLNLLPSAPDDWQSRLVTIEEARPLPFWTAIDRLCEEAGLHYVLGASAAGSQVYEPVFVLFDRKAPRPEAIDDAGPIRVQLSVIQNAAYPSMTVGAQPGLPFRDGPAGRFERRPVPPTSPGQVPTTSIQLHFIAEPRLAILNNGPIRIIEAVDQRGNFIAPANNPGQSGFPTNYYGTAPQHSLRLMQALNLPRDKEAVIKRLRGTLPVQIASRKPDPLSVKLPDGVGHTVKNEEATLTVQSIQTRSPQTPITTMELVLKTQRSPVAASPAMNEFDMPGFRPELSPQQLEVTDATGKVMTWYPSAVRSDGDATRVTLTFAVNANNQTPARVRFHGLTRTTTELEFSFQDVSLK